MSKKGDKHKTETYLKRAIHDLNNIFTANLAAIEQLKLLLNKDVNTKNLLTTLSINSIRAIEITNSLAPTSVKTKKTISLENIISDVQATVKPSLGDKINLIIDVEENLPKTEGNYADLYRALLNITINAVESIDDKGVIEIAVRNVSENSVLEISITDSGSGVFDKDLASIFNVGFSTKERESGVGLSIVKEIIEDHSGIISAKSGSENGTIFKITLPTIALTQKKSLEKKAQNILLIDDDETILELFSNLLTSYNFNVVAVGSGKEAIIKFKNIFDYDLVIVDKIMPDIDGLDLVKNIRKQNSKIPIILISGSQEIFEQDLSYLEINKKIKKPFEFEDILAEIKNLLV